MNSPTRPNGRPSTSFGKLRQRAAARGLATTFESLARLGGLAPQARPERHGLRVVRDVAYKGGDHPAWTLDIYEPQGLRGKAPVVFYVHGGGFRMLSKDTHWLMGLAFAREGWRVVSVNYRLAPKHPFPAAAEDCCAAFAWMIDQADARGFDLDQLVIAGESAGANLATMLTVACLYPRPEPWAAAIFARGVVPRVVLPACGVLEVSNPERFSARRKLPMVVQDAIYRCCDSYLPPGSDPESSALASPLTLLEAADPPERPLPAFFAPVGTRDPLLDDTRRLQAAVSNLGGRCEARYYPGEVHAFHAFLWRSNAQRCWQEMLGFTRENLGPA